MKRSKKRKLSKARCIHNEHLLTCECGAALLRTWGPKEWAYLDILGNQSTVTPDPDLWRLGWEGLAEIDMGLYSILWAREGMHRLHLVHWHLPTPCDAHENPREIPECCGGPMWFAPHGWACRKCTTVLGHDLELERQPA